MIKNIEFSKFREIQSKGYTLDLVYLLELVKDGVDIKALSDLERIKNFIQSLERKGLMTKDCTITLDGQELLDFMNSSGDVIKLTKRKIDDDFEKFWSVFPSTDTFQHKGVSFTGSRSLKTNKEECRLKLKDILNEGDYSIDQIIAAVKYDVLSKKENSVKTRTNKLTYIQNSLTYLRQKSFQGFIDLINQGFKIKEESVVSGGTDI